MAPNKNYIRGRAFEYEVMENARHLPMSQVYRTAGSHGQYDVIAIHPSEHNIILTQCKTRLTKDKTKQGKTVETEYVIFGNYQVFGRKLTKYIRRNK